MNGDFTAHIVAHATGTGNLGCEANNGGNPGGACGSVLLTGTYSSLTWVGTDANTNGASGGDGWYLQISEDSAAAGTPEPGTLWLTGLAAGLLTVCRGPSFLRNRRSTVSAK